MKASLPFKYIIADKKGKNYVVFDFKDDSGKRKRKWVTTDLPADCSYKALTAKVNVIVAKFYEEFLTGRLTKVKEAPKEKEKTELSEEILSDDAECKTGFEFTAFLDYWLETIKPTLARTSHQSYTRYITRIKNYFDERYPHLLLGNLTALQLQQFYNDKYNSGLSGNSVKHYHANIHKALKYAVKMDMLDVNVADKVELPKIQKFEANFYNKDELEQLFEVFKGDRLELVVHIAAYYGLRKSEIIGLKWDSVNFEEKKLTVRRKVSSTYGGGKEMIFVENQLKTESSVRTFPLIPHIEQMLIERKTLEEYYSKLLGKDFDREYDGFVCRDNFGKLITPNFVTSHFKYIIKKNKLKHIRFHDLRHSCASLLLANGISMKAIQEWLGHSTFNVTANFYSHLDFHSKVESAETIAKVLGGDSADTEQAIHDKGSEGKKSRKSST